MLRDICPSSYTLDPPQLRGIDLRLDGTHLIQEQLIADRVVAALYKEGA